MRLIGKKFSDWLVGDRVFLLDKIAVFIVVVVVAAVKDDDDALTNFNGIDIAANSLESDLFVMGDVKNDDEQKLSKIGVLVLALAVWWCKLDKDEGVSRLTKDDQTKRDEYSMNRIISSREKKLPNENLLFFSEEISMKIFYLNKDERERILSCSYRRLIITGFFVERITRRGWHCNEERESISIHKYHKCEWGKYVNSTRIYIHFQSIENQYIIILCKRSFRCFF